MTFRRLEHTLQSLYLGSPWILRLLPHQALMTTAPTSYLYNWGFEHGRVSCPQPLLGCTWYSLGDGSWRPHGQAHPEVLFMHTETFRLNKVSLADSRHLIQLTARSWSVNSVTVLSIQVRHMAANLMIPMSCFITTWLHQMVCFVKLLETFRKYRPGNWMDINYSDQPNHEGWN